MEAREGKIEDMKEHELAEQIEAMRDKPEAWGEPVAEPERKRKSERRQRGAMVSVRFSPDELTAVQAHATKAGMSVSGYLRSLALQTARQPVVTAAVITWAGTTTINASADQKLQVIREDQIPA
jgi:predicted DNA binding CopG/RHH family protein